MSGLRRIFIVDDDPAAGDEVVRHLRSLGYNVTVTLDDRFEGKLGMPVVRRLKLLALAQDESLTLNQLPGRETN